jgi:hypothetical protein
VDVAQKIHNIRFQLCNRRAIARRQNAHLDPLLVVAVSDHFPTIRTTRTNTDVKANVQVSDVLSSGFDCIHLIWRERPTTRIVNDDIAMQAYVGVAQMFQTMQLRCKVDTEPGILLRP